MGTVLYDRSRNQGLTYELRKTAEYLMGISGKSSFSDYTLYWKIGGFCKLDKTEPTNFRHHHNCWEGHFVLGGSGKAIYEKNEYRLSPLALTCTPPEVQHEIRFIGETPLLLLWFLFDFEYTPSHSPDEESLIIRNFLRTYLPIKEDAIGVTSYLKMLFHYRETTGKLDLWANRILTEMFLYIFSLLTMAKPNNKNYPDSPKSNNDTLKKITRHIHKNLNRRISIQEVASLCGMSIRNLQYLFKKKTGKTFTEYVAKIKANEAARALLRGVRVRQAGEIIGIPDPSQFSRFFRRYYGVSPSRYKLTSLKHLRFFSTTFEESGYQKFI